MKTRKTNLRKFIINDYEWLAGEYIIDTQLDLHVLTLNMKSRGWLMPMFYISDHFQFLDASDLNMLLYMFKQHRDIVENDADWYNPYDYSYYFSIKRKLLPDNEIEYSLYIYKDNFEREDIHVKNNFDLAFPEDPFTDRFFNFKLNNHYVVGYLDNDYICKKAYLKYFGKIAGYTVKNLFVSDNYEGACLHFTVQELIEAALKEIPATLIKENTSLRLSLGDVVIECRLSKL